MELFRILFYLMLIINIQTVYCEINPNEPTYSNFADVDKMMKEDSIETKNIFDMSERNEVNQLRNVLELDPYNDGSQYFNENNLDHHSHTENGEKHSMIKRGRKTKKESLETIGFESEDGSETSNKQNTLKGHKKNREYPSFRVDNVGEGERMTNGVFHADVTDARENSFDSMEQAQRYDNENYNYEEDERSHSEQEHRYNKDSKDRPNPHHHVGLRPNIKRGKSHRRTLHGQVDEPYTMPMNTLQRGIQPDQPMHMEDVRNIDRMQHEIRFPHKLLTDYSQSDDEFRMHHGEGTYGDDLNDDKDDDDDEDYKNRVDGYDRDTDNDDDDDDDDDDGDSYKKHDISKGEIVSEDGDETQKDSLKGKVIVAVKNKIIDKADTQEVANKKHLIEVNRNVDISDADIAEAHEHGFDTIDNHDELETGPHDYHIHHPPNHIFKHVTDYTNKDIMEYKTHTTPCENGGIYAPLGDNGYACICPEKFMGTNCEELNYCYRKPCKHCGKCQVTHHWPHYTCECCPKYSGRHCEFRNPCEPDPCANGAECTHDGHTPSCVCKARFKGKFCIEINNCNPNPCINGGTCLEKAGIGNFECVCKPGWLSTICDLPSQCLTDPCKNGGTCNEDGGSFKCMCGEGFVGKTCLEKLCFPNPCVNGGTCVEDGLHFHCVCPPWAKGATCKDISPCQMNPCKNGAHCIDAYSGFRWTLTAMQYFCMCQPPFYGPHCEVNRCRSCDSNAHCDVDHCLCDEGFVGDGFVCHAIIYACHPNPCYNNGLCIDEGHGFFHCNCRPGFLPPYCITPSPCHPNPCVGGTCVPIGDGDFKCQCPPCYTGKLCNIIDPCCPNPCQHYGNCVKTSDKTFQCKCLGERSGDLCGSCDCPKNPDPAIPTATCNLYTGLCECPPGYKKGANVEQSRGGSNLCVKDESGTEKACASSPCLNGGTCIDSETDKLKYTCKCTDQYYGDRCQFLKWCIKYRPCKNGGTCINVGTYSYQCICVPGFAGQNCTLPTPVPPINNPCLPNPCEHSGVCIRIGQSFDCKCHSRYTGPYCGIDRCRDCDDNAKCVGGECICHHGFIGNGYECISDCGKKCLRFQVCTAGTCGCMPGYTFVDDICIPLDSVKATNSIHHKTPKPEKPVYGPTHSTHSFHTVFATHFTKITKKTQSTPLKTTKSPFSHLSTTKAKTSGSFTKAKTTKRSTEKVGNGPSPTVVTGTAGKTATGINTPPIPPSGKPNTGPTGPPGSADKRKMLKNVKRKHDVVNSKNTINFKLLVLPEHNNKAVKLKQHKVKTFINGDHTDDSKNIVSVGTPIQKHKSKSFEKQIVPTVQTFTSIGNVLAGHATKSNAKKGVVRNKIRDSQERNLPNVNDKNVIITTPQTFSSIESVISAHSSRENNKTDGDVFSINNEKLVLHDDDEVNDRVKTDSSSTQEIHLKTNSTKPENTSVSSQDVFPESEFTTNELNKFSDDITDYLPSASTIEKTIKNLTEEKERRNDISKEIDSDFDHKMELLKFLKDYQDDVYELAEDSSDDNALDITKDSDSKVSISKSNVDNTNNKGRAEEMLKRSETSSNNTTL